MLPDKLPFFRPRVAMCNQSINRRCSAALLSIPPYSLVDDVVFRNSWQVFAVVYAPDYLAECNASGAVALPFSYILSYLPAFTNDALLPSRRLPCCMHVDGEVVGHPGAYGQMPVARFPPPDKESPPES